MNDTYSSRWKKFLSNFKIAPLELKVFVVFSFVITVISIALSVFGPRKLEEAIIPITGWLMFMPYSVNLITTFYQLSGNEKKLDKNRRSRMGNILFLELYIGINAVMMLITRGDDYGNPYLMISPWRPVWTTLIPALWILVLYSPRIKEFYLTLNSNSKAE